MEPDLTGFNGRLQSGLQGATGIASGVGRGIGLAMVAGLAGAALAFREIITIGNEYQGTLNEIQAVSGATGDTMGRVASTAKALGSDLSLSGVSAADAAGAMLELAKGGLTVDEAMTAAKGTLQLAGAAQIEGARAAEIQAQALNQFGLQADQAGRVADTLANTANAASGSIEDIALAMKYVGPVASSMSVSMEDTAAAIGLLANNGIMADTAGTSLRGMLASLAAPSAAARKGLAALGIEAFDSQGKFVGFRAVIDQLSVAQGRMSEEQFTAAAAMAFGREPLAAITALAREGGPAFDEMRLAVGRQGGAAEVAAAKMKGLGGAMEGFKSNLETAAISVYELVDGPLEALVRTGTESLAALSAGLDSLGSGGLTDRYPGLLSLVDLFDGLRGNVVGIFGNIRDAVEPVTTAIGGLLDQLGRGGSGSPMELLADGLNMVGDAAEYASGVLVPVGQIVGGLLSLFGELPGPIQAGALALLAWNMAPSLLSGVRGALGGVRGEADGAARSTGLLGSAAGAAQAPVTGLVGGLRQFSGEMRVQRALAASSGQEIGRLASVSAAFETTTVGSLAALRGFRDELRAVRDGAAGAGAPISNLGAALQVVADRVPALGGMRDAFVGADTAVSAFGATAGRVAGDATAALGGRLGGAISGLGDQVARLPGVISSAASTLYTGLGVAAINTAEAIGRIPGAVSSAASTLSTGLGVAAINAAEAVRRIPGAIAEAAGTLRTGLGVAAINAGEGLRNLATAAANAGTSIGTGLRTGLASAVDAARAVPSQMVAAGQAIGTGLRTGLSTAVDAARALPGQIMGAVGAIPGQVGGVLNRLGDTVSGAFVRIGGAVDTGIAALGRFAGVATGIGASAFSGLMRAGGSLVSFLGGPWGVALAAAGIGLSLLAQNHAEAEAAAREQAAALEALRGTLDEYSGAVTQATVNEKAKQLAQDGSLAKVKALGISTEDYVRAALGEEAALQRVQAQLTSHTRGLIESSNAYREGQGELRNLGVSLDDLTAAAQGNGPAMDRIYDAIARIPDLDAQTSVRALVDSMIDAGGASAQLATDLGISNGELAKIQEQTRLAAEASGDFAAKLDLIKAGLGGLASGAPQTEALRTGLAGVAVAAGDAAARAGEAAAQIGGVAAGGEAAAQSMQKSRQAFIDAAHAAGLTIPQAEALATQIGLIPAAASTTFTTNATGVAAEMVTLNAQIQAVPAGKDVVVQALTDEARARLQDLGFQVENLKDGTFRIIGNDEDARAKLAAMVADGNAAVATMRLDANADPATGKVNGTLQFANGSTGTVTIDANGNPADVKIGNTKYKIDTTTGIMTIDGNPGPGEQDLSGLKVSIDRTTGTVTINGNDADARNKIRDLQKPTSSTHTINVRYFVTNSLPASGGGRPIQNQEHGGLLHAMARGGHLSPMRGGVAQVVPPNTWRVIGDRLKDDEAYIPINRSRRSAAIFEETARRMGYTVARMYADGGVAERINAQLAAQRSTSSNSDVVAAIGGLSGRLGAVERAVSITNNFYTESSAKESDMVARVQRRQAALGLLSG